MLRSFSPVIRVCLLLSMLVMVGCGESYIVRGRALEGSFPALMTAPADDPRLAAGQAGGGGGGKGLGEVRIDLYRDPHSLGTELVATGYSADDGSFAIPVDAFGAGWMDEVWRIEAYRSGYQRVDQIIRLPRSGREGLVVLLSPGRSAPPRQRENLYEQYEQFR